MGYWSPPPYGVLEYSLRGTGVLPMGHWSTPYGVRCQRRGEEVEQAVSGLQGGPFGRKARLHA